MPLFIIRDDITRQKVDAIVNTTNEQFYHNGKNVDQRIHEKAGHELDTELAKFDHLEKSEVIITSGYNLPCKYIIHTVGPVFTDGNKDEQMSLKKCYINALSLAIKMKLKSIAFPLISSGTYGYPKDKALEIAIEAIKSFLDNLENDMLVKLVVFDDESFAKSKNFDFQVEELIDEKYAKSLTPEYLLSGTKNRKSTFLANMPLSKLDKASKLLNASEDKENGKEDKNLDILDESYREMLFRLISERNLTDAQCYKKANVSKAVFNNIVNKKGYIPKKSTLLALCISLKLNIDTTNELLLKAGYGLSPVLEFDKIVKENILRKNYDVFDINIQLFNKDQVQLGSS